MLAQPGRVGNPSGTVLRTSAPFGLIRQSSRLPMLNRRSFLAVAATLVLGLFVTGCGSGLIAFTHELRAENRLTDDEIKNLQFYVSHKITLRRELESGNREVTGN